MTRNVKGYYSTTTTAFRFDDLAFAEETSFPPFSCAPRFVQKRADEKLIRWVR